jgi:hypothetical protein
MKTMTKEEISFLLKWIISEQEANKRIILIDEYFESIASESSIFKDYLSHKTTISQKYIAHSMAWLKPITDDMLMNFIQGIVKLFLVIRFKRESDEREYDQLVEPAFNIFVQFFKSQPWQKYMIEQGVDEGAEFKTQTVIVPIDVKNLFQYSKRIKKPLLTLYDIDELKKQYYHYLFKEYNDQRSDINKQDSIIKVISEKSLQKIHRIFTLCKHKNVIQDINFFEFITYVEVADFSNLYREKVLIKSKFKFAIYPMSIILDNTIWYKQAAKSIDEYPNRCSGANVSDEWKNMLIDIANSKN